MLEHFLFGRDKYLQPSIILEVYFEFIFFSMALFLEANKNLYEGAPEHEVKEALVLSARSLVEVEPNYTFATARILLDSLRSEALSFLEITENATHEEIVMSTITAMHNDTQKAEVYGTLPVVGLSVFGKIIQN